MPQFAARRSTLILLMVLFVGSAAALQFQPAVQRQSRTTNICMAKTKTKTKKVPVASKGFGAAKPKKRAAVVPLAPDIEKALDSLKSGEQSIEHYLNPAHFEDPQTMRDIANQLQSGEVVLLRDAFRPEFAEMVYSELSSKDVAWELNEAYFPDGYGHRHNNVYDRESWSARLNATLDVFAHEASQRFMKELTGRDCSGPTVGAPSWYQEGHHSLPHTDWVGQRTVAYVWHLSKNWKPEWGGALYWAQVRVPVHTLTYFSLLTSHFSLLTSCSLLLTSPLPARPRRRHPPRLVQHARALLGHDALGALCDHGEPRAQGQAAHFQRLVAVGKPNGIDPLPHILTCATADSQWFDPVTPRS